MAKTVHLVGNAHLDPVWLWPWQEGYQESKATFRSALDRMREFPDFIFTSSSAAHYAWVEESDPDMFEEIRARVREGRWVICGGWWVQPDCNIPSGESLCRQALYGQRYFLRVFGRRAKTGYNVDSFGHNAMMPQLLRCAGLDAYAFLRPGPHEKALPGDVFRWRSPDGSEVLAGRIPYEYTYWREDLDVHLQRCAERVSDPDGQGLCFYGVGNHGGGPTRRNLEIIGRVQAQGGDTTYVLSSPDTFFKAISPVAQTLPVVTGDLLHHASGCYAAHSGVKQWNRQAENRLVAAEKIVSLAGMVVGHQTRADFGQAWKNVLFNQFHDILAGTSIASAYQDTREEIGEALSISSRAMNAAVQSLSWKINIPVDPDTRPIVVFHPHGFPVCSEVEIESSDIREGTVLLDEASRVVPHQLVTSEAACNGRCRLLFRAELPALGWRTFRLGPGSSPVGRERSAPVDVAEHVLDNGWIRLELDPDTGHVMALRLLKEDVNLIGEPSGMAVVLDDPSDTWSHQVRRYEEVRGVFKLEALRKIESGPVRSAIRVVSGYGDSRMIQTYQLGAEADEVVVRTTVDWQERQAVLKIRYDMNLDHRVGTASVPYGHVEREMGGEEYPMQAWFDVTGFVCGTMTEAGLSILNDSKHSYDMLNRTFGLTVLRSPIWTHHEPHVPAPDAEIRYMDQGEQTFTHVLVPHAGGWKDAGIPKRALALNQPAIPLFESFHEGPLSQTACGFTCNAPGVLADVIKPAEEGDGWVLRAYESCGAPVADCRMTLPFLDREIRCKFGTQQIRTFLIPCDSGRPVREVDAVETEIDSRETR